MVCFATMGGPQWSFELSEEQEGEQEEEEIRLISCIVTSNTHIYYSIFPCMKINFVCPVCCTPSYTYYGVNRVSFVIAIFYVKASVGY